MQQAISYRDRDGFVIVQKHSVKRYVSFSYAQAYDHLMSSGLYQHLVDEGLLISHKEVIDRHREEEGFYKILEPEWISFMNYPYEWSAVQWQEMILAFLRINCICLNYGMILKDATPFNFTFYRGHCIFFDTLSFELYEEGKPWMAYRQFCETMLGPLSLIFFNDASWARMMQAYINGWPLFFVSKNLPLKTRLYLPILLHIHWHARFQSGKQKQVRSKGLTKEKLLVLWQMMEKSIQKWTYHHKSENWVNYYDVDIQSNEYLQSKTITVTRWLETIKPGRVIDLGANNGMFSMIASKYSGEVIAVESDHACIEKLRLDIRSSGITNIETLIADLTQPTAGVGWGNEERTSLLQRLNGDMVLALALIHHLCISANIPLSFVARLFAQITTRYVLIEFVPRSDRKVTEMLHNRKDIFDDYTETEFTRCFGIHFRLQQFAKCSLSDRKLYLWEKK